MKFRERQLRGVLLPSLALVSLLTGVIGYLLAIPQSLRAVGDVGNALYASFRLFSQSRQFCVAACPLAGAGNIPVFPFLRF